MAKAPSAGALILPSYPFALRPTDCRSPPWQVRARDQADRDQGLTADDTGVVRLYSLPSYHPYPRLAKLTPRALHARYRAGPAAHAVRSTRSRVAMPAAPSRAQVRRAEEPAHPALALRRTCSLAGRPIRIGRSRRADAHAPAPALLEPAPAALHRASCCCLRCAQMQHPQLGRATAAYRPLRPAAPSRTLRAQ